MPVTLPDYPIGACWSLSPLTESHWLFTCYVPYQEDTNILGPELINIHVKKHDTSPFGTLNWTTPLIKRS